MTQLLSVCVSEAHSLFRSDGLLLFVLAIVVAITISSTTLLLLFFFTSRYSIVVSWSFSLTSPDFRRMRDLSRPNIIYRDKTHINVFNAIRSPTDVARTSSPERRSLFASLVSYFSACLTRLPLKLVLFYSLNRFHRGSYRRYYSTMSIEPPRRNIRALSYRRSTPSFGTFESRFRCSLGRTNL